MSKFTHERYILLDAFRGIAILWIVCFHVLAGLRENYGLVLNYIISKGHLGVQIFFVISGYGIAASVLSNMSPKPFPFLFSRLKRIYSTYWWHLLFAALIIPIASSVVSMLKSHNFEINIVDYNSLEWLQIITLSKVFTATNWKLNLAFLPLNGVIWYIAIIVQIYFFIFLCLFSKKSYTNILFISFLISLLSYIPSVNLLIPYGLFIPNFHQFYIGVLVYQILHNELVIKTKNSLFLLTLFLSLSATLYCAYINNEFLSLTFSIFIGSIFLVLYRYDNHLNRSILVKLFCLVGAFSYSLYLLHVPLYPFVGMFIRNLIPLSASVSSPIFLVPGIIILSFIWYLIFEKASTPRETISMILSPRKVICSGISDVKNVFKKSDL